MPLHRLNSVTVGVPNVAATRSYYQEFGLTATDDGWLATTDGGPQLRIVKSPSRRLVEMEIGVDDDDDLDRIDRRLRGLEMMASRASGSVTAVEPITRTRVVVSAVPRLEQPARQGERFNGPGFTDRPGVRAPAILRTQPVQPRKLGHVVIGSTDQALTQAFFTDGIGLKVSDVIEGSAAFMRCSTDHHNVLVHQAPVNFLHHTSWQVDDVDEVGRGATSMLREHPERHIWGLGRHHIGSNFFWYLRDPAGNFSEYYSDLDCIPEDDLWRPEVWGAAESLYNWGPPPPPSFIHPEDLAELMTGAHSGR
ncbi:VOC family protein [Streptomyces sp. NBC_01727]|uniref:VOC family protein n=1 Tax=Streptomyces sp. NBC_01727 TaxID=2975924 RepID=UPI002E0F37F5|nr:VOC family protein [Streptomyces sp. NBC_01727]